VRAAAPAIALLLAFVSAAAQPDDPSPVTATARTDKTETTVGEAFVVEVEAEGPDGTTYTFPPAAESETAELGQPAPATAAGASGGSANPGAPGSTPPADLGGAPALAAALPPNVHRYEARVFALGEVTLPSVVVRYRLPGGTEGEATAPGPKVKVGSLLPKDAPAQTIVDIRPPVGVGIAPVFWAALAAALVLLAGAGVLLWRRLRRPLPEAAKLPEPELDPATDARQALDRLARGGHFGRGDGRGFYIALSAIAKRYLERRLQAPIVEMTTAEMLAHLRESEHAADLHATMRDLAPAADQVKFAKGEALSEEGDRHLAAVRQLVDRLEERLRPRPDEGKAA
jgi:hypothetical protein